MTTIVAVEDETGVTLGWDSLTTAGNSQYSTQRSKVVVNGEVVFAVAGAVSVANVLEFMHVPPVDRADPRRWAVRVLMPAVRAALAGAGMLEQRSGTSMMPNVLMVVVAGRLFDIGPDFSVDARAARFEAIGSGAQFALGALHAAAGSPAERVRAALRAATALDAYTGGPTHVAFVASPPEPDAYTVELQRAA